MRLLNYVAEANERVVGLANERNDNRTNVETPETDSRSEGIFGEIENARSAGHLMGGTRILLRL